MLMVNLIDRQLVKTFLQNSGYYLETGYVFHIYVHIKSKPFTPNAF